MDRKRIMSLDIIKGIAMIMVIVVHYNQSFSSNVPLFRFCQMGCQIFFVASGFGAAMSIAKKSENESYSDTCKKFYLSRISAIAPAWWFMMAAIYLINTITLYFFGRTVGFSTNRSITGIICNLFFLNGLNPLCNNDVMPGGWYIGTTMLLYLMAPIMFYIYDKVEYKQIFCAITSIFSGGG